MNEFPLRIGTRDLTLIEGPAGWGEYSPLPGYPCDPAAARRAAEEAAELGFPPTVRRAVPVNALVEWDTPLDRALSERLEQFSAVKVKVGRAPIDVDLHRVATIRSFVGPSVALRIDANGAWDLWTAVDFLERARRYDLEFAEQPVASIEDMATLRRKVAVPIAADECVVSVADVERLRFASAADVLVLKVQPVGGVRAALALAQAAGIPVAVSSMMETSIGVSAGLALAAALDALPFACGLATLDESTPDVVQPPLRPRNGVLEVPPVWPVPDPALLGRYASSRAGSGTSARNVAR